MSKIELGFYMAFAVLMAVPIMLEGRALYLSSKESRERRRLKESK